MLGHAGHFVRLFVLVDACRTDFFAKRIIQRIVHRLSFVVGCLTRPQFYRPRHALYHLGKLSTPFLIQNCIKFSMVRQVANADQSKQSLKCVQYALTRPALLKCQSHKVHIISRRWPTHPLPKSLSQRVYALSQKVYFTLYKEYMTPLRMSHISFKTHFLLVMI